MSFVSTNRASYQKIDNISIGGGKRTMIEKLQKQRLVEKLSVNFQRLKQAKDMEEYNFRAARIKQLAEKL